MRGDDTVISGSNDLLEVKLRLTDQIGPQSDLQSHT